ncbi:DUF221 domain-containing protein [Histoplasma capsulatum H143]|uniref:DUF221 domain-containing protein n=1 Tax=Ajellomyces capsulatus (strain H143) TaxID=544712 RepID=C6H8X1_AJECH|nr:DUF221 domain-containing protein [Histoplasma capsulatum H143]
MAWVFIADLVEERDKIAFHLEDAETKLIKLANAVCVKSLKAKPADEENCNTATGNEAQKLGSVAAY